VTLTKAEYDRLRAVDKAASRAVQSATVRKISKDWAAEKSRSEPHGYEPGPRETGECVVSLMGVRAYAPGGRA
jgi:hypothetical protein